MSKRLTDIFKLTLLIIVTSLIIGSAVALFLWLLTAAIHLRFKYTWLLYLLPLAGILIHWIYKSVGKSSEKGNNLIIDEIHQPGGGVPWRMAPIILATTIITHLFGGSAGREGTAVQMGGSIAAFFCKWFKVNETGTRILLITGIAAGFGAVFGTPLTGAIFAIEVLTLGKLEYKAILPALIAGLIGDWTVDAWHVHHTVYHIDIIAALPVSDNIILIGKVIIASAVFGLVSYVFAAGVHQTKNLFLKFIKVQWLIPVLGGLIIIGLTYLLGKPDYLSLGVDAEYPGAVTVPSAFAIGGADTWSWLWKSIYTIITLATGFKGGEVTPLFYIGATLGNSLAVLLNSPVSLFAALGFIAVFAGATNTPLACTIMGAELFGSEHLLLFAIACFTAYLFSGHNGIYSSQLKNFSSGRNYIYQKIYKYRFNFKKRK
ncbi:voltage-gated chloride channel family protein [Mucilaginibacter puniceus]